MSLIKKREDANCYDSKYKITLSGQIIIKIEEYRRSSRMLKASLVKKNQNMSIIDDIYWKGIIYIDKCRAEKEMRE